MADLMTPGEVAAQLGVHDRTVRRMAIAYETVFDNLPRLRPDDDRSPRLWPVEAARRVQVAHLALKSGKVSSLEGALIVVRDGGDLPVRAEPPAGQGVDTLTADLLAELLTEIRAVRIENAELRTLAEAQGHELAALRSEMAAGRALPAPVSDYDELVRELEVLRKAVTIASTMPSQPPAEVVAELASTKITIASLMAEKRARDRHPLVMLLSMIGVRL